MQLHTGVFYCCPCCEGHGSVHCCGKCCEGAELGWGIRRVLTCAHPCIKGVRRHDMTLIKKARARGGRDIAATDGWDDMPKGGVGRWSCCGVGCMVGRCSGRAPPATPSPQRGGTARIHHALTGGSPQRATGTPPTHASSSLTQSQRTTFTTVSNSHSLLPPPAAPPQAQPGVVAHQSAASHATPVGAGKPHVQQAVAARPASPARTASLTPSTSPRSAGGDGARGRGRGGLAFHHPAGQGGAGVGGGSMRGAGISANAHHPHSLGDIPTGRGGASPRRSPPASPRGGSGVSGGAAGAKLPHSPGNASGVTSAAGAHRPEMCEECGTAEADVWCTNCEALFCDVHHKQLHASKTGQRHLSITIKYRPPMCHEHAGERCVLYCEHCRRAVCRLCCCGVSGGLHAQHSIVTLGEAEAAAVAALKGGVEALEAERTEVAHATAALAEAKRKAKDRADEARRAVNETFAVVTSRVIKALDARKTELLGAVDEVAVPAIAAIMTREAALGRAAQLAQDAATSASRALVANNALSTRDAVSPLVDTAGGAVRAALAEAATMQPLPVIEAAFPPNFDRVMQDAIANYGMVGEGEGQGQGQGETADEAEGDQATLGSPTVTDSAADLSSVLTPQIREHPRSRQQRDAHRPSSRARGSARGGASRDRAPAGRERSRRSKGSSRGGGGGGGGRYAPAMMPASMSDLELSNLELLQRYALEALMQRTSSQVEGTADLEDTRQSWQSQNEGTYTADDEEEEEEEEDMEEFDEGDEEEHDELYEELEDVEDGEMDDVPQEDTADGDADADADYSTDEDGAPRDGPALNAAPAVDSTYSTEETAAVSRRVRGLRDDPDHGSGDVTPDDGSGAPDEDSGVGGGIDEVDATSLHRSHNRRKSSRSDASRRRSSARQSSSNGGDGDRRRSGRVSSFRERRSVDNGTGEGAVDAHGAAVLLPQDSDRETLTDLELTARFVAEQESAAAAAVLAAASGDTDVEQAAQLAAEALALRTSERIFHAMKGFGTEDDGILACLQDVDTQARWDLVKAGFRVTHPDFEEGDLYEAFKSEFTGKEFAEVERVFAAKGIAL